MSIFRREPPGASADGGPSSPDATATAGTPASAPGVSTGTSPLAALPAPKSDRLNRNALSIIAAFAGMGVIAMVVMIQPAPPNSSASGAAPPTPGGTYLDQPVRGSVAAAGGTVGAGAGTPAPTPGDYPTGAGAEGQMAAGTTLAPGYAPLPATPDPYPPAYQPPGAYASTGYTPGGAPAAPPPTVAELRAAAYLRALDASPTGEAPAGALVERVGTGQSEGEMALATGVPAAATAAGSDAVGASTSAVTRADQFMQTAALASGQRTVQALTVQASPGPYSVQAGTVIPAVLMTEINSDLPGECLAQITRDVYDSRSQRHLLIPRGAKLLCRYDDQLATGQSRLLVAWTRILLPDGRSVSLPGLPATDATGARGVSDQVDRHAKKAFGTAAALSLIGAAVQLSQPQRGSVFSPPSAGQVMAGALGQELNQVSVEMLRRDLANRQTIRIRQGVEFNVFLNTDLTFPGPYAVTRTDGAQTTAAVDGMGRVVPVVRRER